MAATISSARSTNAAIPDLTGQITGVDQHPSAFGGFADIWVGYWAPDSRPARKVAIKVLRFRSADESHTKRMDKNLRNEIRVWKRLRHPNILPLYGTVSDSKFGPRPAMVCPWQENGNLSVFLEKNAMTLGSIERYRILLGILSGLSYLHRNSIIHGDLTGSNVLLGAGGVRNVRLSDFGLSRILGDPAISNSTVSSGSTVLGGACRWAAPETIIPSHSGGPGRQATKASDVYSFGRVMLQVFSGRIPYYHIPNQYTVLYHLCTGNGPPRSLYPHITGNVWELIQMCSTMEPWRRPTLITIFEQVKRLLAYHLPRHVQDMLQNQEPRELEFQAHQVSALLDILRPKLITTREQTWRQDTARVRAALGIGGP